MLILGVTLTLALRGEAGGQLGHLLPVKGVAVLAVHELVLVLVLLLQLLVSFQLLTGFVPCTGSLDLDKLCSLNCFVCLLVL